MRIDLNQPGEDGAFHAAPQPLQARNFSILTMPIFWPSTLIDPRELYLLGEPVHWPATAVYSTGFFMFWMIAAASSAFTCFLQCAASDINRKG